MKLARKMPTSQWKYDDIFAMVTDSTGIYGLLDTQEYFHYLILLWKTLADDANQMANYSSSYIDQTRTVFKLSRYSGTA